MPIDLKTRMYVNWAFGNWGSFHQMFARHFVSTFVIIFVRAQDHWCERRELCSYKRVGEAHASSYDFLCVRMIVQTFGETFYSEPSHIQVRSDESDFHGINCSLICKAHFLGIGCKSWRIKSAFSYAQADQLSDLFSVKLRDWTEKAYQNLKCLFLRAKTERSCCKGTL